MVPNIQVDQIGDVLLYESEEDTLHNQVGLRHYMPIDISNIA